VGESSARGGEVMLRSHVEDWVSPTWEYVDGCVIRGPVFDWKVGYFFEWKVLFCEY